MQKLIIALVLLGLLVGIFVLIKQKEAAISKQEVAVLAPIDPLIKAGEYILDKTHASIIFSVNHLGFSNYTASFNDFDATLNLDPQNPQTAFVKAVIYPISLDLPSPPEGFPEEMMRDKWFNNTIFPTINFESTGIEMTGERTALVHGTLELIGVKKGVVLDVKFNGGYSGHPMDPNPRIGFSAKGSFNRSDFGMNYGIPAVGTTMGVSDEVVFVIDAEFTGSSKEEVN